MSKPRDQITSAYVAKFLRDWTAGERGDLAALAKKYDLSPSNLTQVRDGTLGVSSGTGEKFAKMCGFKTYPDLMNAAKAWHHSGTKERQRSLLEKRLELVERYPNRVLAIDAARTIGLSEDAIGDVARMQLEADEDQPVKWWFEQIQARDAVYSNPFAKPAPPGHKDNRDF